MTNHQPDPKSYGPAVTAYAFAVALVTAAVFMSGHGRVGLFVAIALTLSGVIVSTAGAELLVDAYRARKEDSE